MYCVVPSTSSSSDKNYANRQALITVALSHLMDSGPERFESKRIWCLPLVVFGKFRIGLRR